MNGYIFPTKKLGFHPVGNEYQGRGLSRRDTIRLAFLQRLEMRKT